MMLRTSKTSPYVRKVLIVAALTGLGDRIETVDADLADPADDLITQNPLGKIPALVLDDGTCLFDSRVIAAYLDGLVGGAGLYPEGDALWPALRLQALADGICDAAVLEVYETRMRTPETFHQPWVDRQRGKVDRALATLDDAPPVWTGRPTIGDVALACALGMQDLRFEGRWRKHARLAAWLDAFAAAVPAYAATDPAR